MIRLPESESGPTMLNMAVFASCRKLAAGILLTGTVIITGCSTPPPPVVELPPPEVTVATPIERELADYLEFTGRIQAIDNVEIRAQVTGYLLNVNFEEGEDVTEGKVLFEIDPRPYDAALKAAEASVASARAELKKANADVTRDRLAFEKEAISAQQLDTSIALEGIALAAVASAEAEVEKAKLDVEFTTIRSPVNGRVGRAMITRGNLIASGQLDTPLTTVVSVKPVDVYFDIDQNSMMDIQERTRKQDPDVRAGSVREANVPVLISLRDGDGFPREGLLDFADNTMDPDTGTIRVRGRFQNDDDFLKPGMAVTVRLPVTQSKIRLLIPERAIGTDQGQRYVLLVKDDNSTERRDVTLGVRVTEERRIDDDVVTVGMRIVESGLKAGDRVIVDGIQRVRAPAPVNPQEIPVESKPSADTGSAEESAEAEEESSENPEESSGQPEQPDTEASTESAP